MKRYLSIGVMLLVAVVTSLPAHSQTSTTTLQMSAHWDDGTSVAGTVTLGKVNSTGPDTVLYKTTLSGGWSSVSTSLAANSIYDVTLTAPDGTQLVKFPLVTSLINPSNLQGGVITLIFHKTNKSLASAKIQVSMAF